MFNEYVDIDTRNLKNSELYVMSRLWNSLVIAKMCKDNLAAQIVVYQGGLLLRGRGWLIGIICILAKSITYVKCTIIQPTKDLITLFPLMFVCVVLPHSMILQLVLFHKLFYVSLNTMVSLYFSMFVFFNPEWDRPVRI